MAQAKKAALPHRRLICRLDAALQLVLMVLMLSCSSVWRNFAIACMQFSLLDLGCNIGAASFDATLLVHAALQFLIALMGEMLLFPRPLPC